MCINPIIESLREVIAFCQSEQQETASGNEGYDWGTGFHSWVCTRVLLDWCDLRSRRKQGRQSPPRWSERASIRAKMECAWMLLVGRDVSVRLGLGGLPGRGGMRWVWDGGDAVGQGQRSSHNALHSCPSSRQPARCYANQPCGEPTTETCFHSLKYADTVKARAVTINQYRIDSWIVSDIFRMHRILSGIDSELRF